MADRNGNTEATATDFEKILAQIMELSKLDTFPQTLETLDLPPLDIGRWLEE